MLSNTPRMRLQPGTEIGTDVQQGARVLCPATLPNKCDDVHVLGTSQEKGETLMVSSLFKVFIAGSVSGTCSTILFQPLDLLKTRVQASISKGHGPAGLIATFKTVLKNDRLVGLWRGVVPSVMRCVPGMGIYFSCLHIGKITFSIQQPRPLESLLMGAGARSIAGTALLPCTVLKTRFESGEYNYQCMVRALKSIYALEGVRGLFSGLGATLLRDVPFSALYFTFYSQTKRTAQMSMVLTDLQTPMMHFCCGLTAGLLASIVTQPPDVIKTHMQVYPQKYKRIRDVLVHVYMNDGLTGFFRGMVPRLIRRTLMAALAWTVYEQIMKSVGLKT